MLIGLIVLESKTERILWIQAANLQRLASVTELAEVVDSAQRIHIDHNTENTYSFGLYYFLLLSLLKYLLKW